MLNKETSDKLKVLGIDVSKLTEAVKAENEVSLEVPTLYTEDQKNAFGSNRFNEGKFAMGEILAKDIKSKYQVEVEGKDPFVVIEAYAEKRLKEVNVKPNEQLERLNAEKSELQNKLQAITTEKEGLVAEFNNKIFNYDVISQLNQLIPDNTIIGKQDITTLFLNTYNVKKDNDGRTIVTKGQEVLKDNLLNPLQIKDVVTTFLDDRKLIDKSGMGGNDRTGGGSTKFKTMADFEGYCEKNKIEPMSNEGQALLSSNKDVDFKYY